MAQESRGPTHNNQTSPFQLLDKKSLFAAIHSDFNSLKSGLLRLTGQPNSLKGSAAKVKDGVTP